MPSKRTTRKFDGLLFYLSDRDMTKTAARLEARRIRASGNYARVTTWKGGVTGKFAVWERKRS